MTVPAVVLLLNLAIPAFSQTPEPSQSAQSSAQAAAPAKNDTTDRVDNQEIVVTLKPTTVTRPPQYKSWRTPDGILHVQTEPEAMLKGDMQVNGETVAVYVPAQGPYTLENTSTDPFENSSTQVSVDGDNNGLLDVHELWSADTPLRIGDSMFAIKAVDAAGAWLRLTPSTAPLGGLIVGKPCPACAFTTLEGSPIKLEDYKGKHLLLDLWSKTCVPCLLGMPFVKGVEDKIGKEKLAVLLLSLDQSMAVTPQEDDKLLQEKNITWTNLYLPEGMTSSQKWLNLRHAGYVLIGADGRVRSVGAHIEEIQQLLEQDNARQAQSTPNATR